MSKIYDLEYSEQGLFTVFMPNTVAGIRAWNEMIEQDGAGGHKVFSLYAGKVAEQLRAAGYSVGKARKVSLVDEDALLTELMG